VGIRLLLVVRNRSARAAYERELAGFDDAEYDTVESLADVPSTMKKTAYNGLLLDIGTMVKALDAEKANIRELLDVFPAVRLKWDSGNNAVNVLYHGQGGSEQVLLKDFVEERCRPFPARPIRRSVRKPLYLNVVISIRPDFPDPQIHRANTLDVSEGGCFVYSVNDWATGSSVWVRILEFEGTEPFSGRVCWHCPWGNPHALPGIGLEFAHLSDEQLARLRRELNPRS